ncbi:ferredoxin [Mycobacterium sp. HUMS_1102779]|uniref:ferredoxin n=1 Tax=Mycobacterium sp. HUMS_1102779 TaxID=3383487 RepID=UPI00389994C2
MDCYSFGVGLFHPLLHAGLSRRFPQLRSNVFEDDDQGYGHVIGDDEVPQEHAEAARNGAANCPEGAISVTE